MLLEEFLLPMGITQRELADAIHVPYQRINEIVHWTTHPHSNAQGWTTNARSRTKDGPLRGAAQKHEDHEPHADSASYFVALNTVMESNRIGSHGENGVWCHELRLSEGILSCTLIDPKGLRCDI